MVKQAMYAVFFCVPCCAMDNNSNESMKMQATKIKIGTMKECYELPINHNSTILAIKQAMEAEEGIPLEQQILKVRSKGESVILHDHEKIKDIIQTYKTEFLQLFLIYKK